MTPNSGEYTEANFTVDDVVYLAHIWPTGKNMDINYQVIYFQEDQPYASRIICLRNQPGGWIQEVDEPFPKQSPEFVAELGKQIELVF